MKSLGSLRHSGGWRRSAPGPGPSLPRPGCGSFSRRRVRHRPGSLRRRWDGDRMDLAGTVKEVVSDSNAEVLELNSPATGSPPGSLSLDLANGQLTASWTVNSSTINVSGEVRCVEAISGPPTDRFMFCWRRTGIRLLCADHDEHLEGHVLLAHGHFLPPPSGEFTRWTRVSPPGASTVEEPNDSGPSASPRRILGTCGLSLSF